MPGLVASYDIRPENREGLFWFWHFTNFSHTYLLRHLATYLPETHTGQQRKEIKGTVVHMETPPPQPFYSPISGTTWVSRCQKRTSGHFTVQGKINRGRHNDQLAGRHFIRTSQCPPPPFPPYFYRPDALPAAQPTVSKHRKTATKVGVAVLTRKDALVLGASDADGKCCSEVRLEINEKSVSDSSTTDPLIFAALGTSSMPDTSQCLTTANQ